jgi:hypothetical protein
MRDLEASALLEKRKMQAYYSSTEQTMQTIKAYADKFSFSSNISGR